MGSTTFYRPGDTVDTSSMFTVVTRFITDDATSSGTLTKIKRFYVQNGKLIPNSQSDVSGVTANSIIESFCAAEKTAFGDTDYFDQRGGLAGVGED